MTPGNTLFRMVRTLTRPGIQHGEPGSEHGRLVMAVEAVASVKANGSATINDIAAELGIDQSGASRLMSQAMAAGLVQRARAEGDGRARECGLTPAGEELLNHARAWQEDVFARLTAGWTADERDAFEVQMNRILSAVSDIE